MNKLKQSDWSDLVVCEPVIGYFMPKGKFGCTTWTPTKRMEKSLTATTQECCEQYWRSPGGNTPQNFCSVTYHPSRKLSKLDELTHAGHCWRSKDELISDVLLWILLHGRAKAGRPARTYIQQLSVDTGCNHEDLPEAMNDKEGWRERVRDIRADGTTRWWWICRSSRQTK